MKKQMLMIGLMLITFLFLIGCSSSDDDDDFRQGTGFVTYNTGLAVGFVDYADDRLPFIGESLATLDGDVVCLQEVWLQEHIDSIIALGIRNGQ